MRESSELDDGGASDATGQHVQVRRAQGGDIQSMKGSPHDALGVEHRVVQVEPVDKEDGAVDDEPPE